MVREKQVPSQRRSSFQVQEGFRLGVGSDKKKKKSGLVSESVLNNVEDNQLESPTVVTEDKVKDDLSTDAKVDNGAETEKQSKHKSKKNKRSNIEGNAKEQIAVTDNKEKEDLAIDAKAENGTETEKKSKHTKRRKISQKVKGMQKSRLEILMQLFQKKRISKLQMKKQHLRRKILRKGKDQVLKKMVIKIPK